MKILLHACCGPCSLEPTRLLKEAGDGFAVYFANANIHPQNEYEHRLETIQALASERAYPLIEGSYDTDAWEETAGRIGQELEELREGAGIANEVVDSPNPYPLPPKEDKGPHVAAAREKAAQLRRARCRACYRLRFEETAHYAAEHGFDAVGTTLSVSPFQYIDIIEEELLRACKTAGVNCAFTDYRPYFEDNERISKEMGIYRQNFCGCHFSDEEAQLERTIRKAARKAKKAALKAAKKEAAEKELLGSINENL